MSLADRPAPYTTRATRSEPEVGFGFEDNVLRMAGECWMIDTHRFFAPHKRWLREFLNGLDEPVTFVFELTRANSSSKQHIIDIVGLLMGRSGPNRPTTVEWNTPAPSTKASKISASIWRRHSRTLSTSFFASFHPAELSAHSPPVPLFFRSRQQPTEFALLPTLRAGTLPTTSTKLPKRAR